MGQIDSFKKVLGLTDQPTQIPEPEPVVKEEKAKVVKPRQREKPKRKLTATLAVSADTRSRVKDLMYWARSEELITEATDEDVLLLMLDCVLEKYPKSKNRHSRAGG